MTYQTAAIATTAIDKSLQEKMFALYCSYYAGSSESQFVKDLLEKREAVLLFHDDDLVGFTTWMCYDHQWIDKNIRVFFSGDTIVHQNHWGQQQLAFANIHRIAACRRENADVPLYWFLLVKGHRTFRYLPAFVMNWYPHWNSDDQNNLKSLVDSLASERYGTFYNPVTGVIEFPESMGYLNDDIAKPSERDMDKDSVKFFLERNPGFHRGHELACVCELSEENLRPMAARIFAKSSPVV